MQCFVSISMVFWKWTPECSQIQGDVRLWLQMHFKYNVTSTPIQNAIKILKQMRTILKIRSNIDDFMNCYVSQAGLIRRLEQHNSRYDETEYLSVFSIFFRIVFVFWVYFEQGLQNACRYNALSNIGSKCITNKVFHDHLSNILIRYCQNTATYWTYYEY